jgi:hypothetical protein
MKFLRLLPKSLRKKLMIKELNRFRKTRDRKLMLNSVRRANIISKLLKQRSKATQKEAQKYGAPNMRSAKQMLLADSEYELQQSKEVLTKAQNFASRKKERKKLRKFWELDKD